MIDCQKKGEPRARSRQTRYRNSFPATMRVTLVFEVQTHSESHKQKNIIWERQQATVTREKNMRWRQQPPKFPKKKQLLKIEKKNPWLENRFGGPLNPKTKTKKHSLEQMNSPSCARSFYQQHTAKQILTRFVASFFFYILYISRLQSRSTSTNTNKLNLRNLFTRPKRKNLTFPRQIELIFFPWNKSLALTHVQPKSKKHSLPLQHHCT